MKTTPWRRIVLWLLLLLAVIFHRPLSVAAIRGYQRFLSPYKGYHCAYGAYYQGGASCSEYGRRSIERFGLVEGGLMLRARFDECAFAASRLRAVAAQQKCGTWKSSGCCEGSGDIYLSCD